MKKILKPIIIMLAILVLSILIVVLYYFNQINRHYKINTAQSFEIIAGQSRSSIIINLRDKDLLGSTWPELLYVKLNAPNFLPGIYTIPTTYSFKELLVLFNNDSKKEVKLTIPEGWNRQQIAEKIVDLGLNKETFLSLTKNNEGKLFPDTYYIGEKTTEEELMNRMTANFQQKVKVETVSNDKLILASIVEREARNNSERALIAGIYQHRLDIGMALEADPTVQYAKYTDLGLAPLEDGKHNYWAPITVKDYKSVNSKFNTYLYPGLPPAPICNPGQKSIDAALSPQRTEAIYFFHTSSGEIITSKTLAEHNANKTKYLR
jgi:UPF0755 protein